MKDNVYPQSLLDFIEGVGLSSVVAPPMKYGKGMVIYDCLLRIEKEGMSLYVQMIMPANAAIPDVVAIFTHVALRARMANMSEGNLDVFQKLHRKWSRRRASLDVLMAAFREFNRMEGELHDILGCDAFKVAMNNSTPGD